MSTTSSKWDFLYGVKPETPTQVALRELGKGIAETFKRWPPEVLWTSERNEPEKGASDLPQPDEEMIRQSMRCVHWELAREFEARSHFEGEQKNRGEMDARKKSRRLITDIVYEGILEVVERTEGRISRKDALEALGEIEIRLLRSLRRLPS